jgi:hypothetical protein
MARGLYDTRNIELKQLKMAWSKNIFHPRSIHHKMCYNYVLLTIFIKDMLF